MKSREEKILSRFIVDGTDYDKYIGRKCWSCKEEDIEREIEVFSEAQTYIVVAVQKLYNGQLGFRVKNLSWTLPHTVNCGSWVEDVVGVPLDCQFGSVKRLNEVYFVDKEVSK